jgi:hypothetical protein
VIFIVIGLLLVCLVTCLGIAVQVTRTEQGQERLNEVMADRQIYQAEIKLHERASDAFSSMMEAARQVRPNDWQP